MRDTQIIHWLLSFAFEDEHIYEHARNKHKWSKLEDKIVLSKTEHLSWRYVASLLPDRSDDAVRNRWMRLTKTKVRKTNKTERLLTKKWSENEDMLLQESISKFGIKWKQIHKLVFPHKSVQSIRNRWNRVMQI